MLRTPTFQSDLVAPLLRDWDRFRRSPLTRSTIVGWGGPIAEGIDEHHPDPATEILCRTGFLAVDCAGDPDLTLARLVELAHHDEVAARIVLQRMLPPIVSVARRRGPRHGGARAATDQLVAMAWIVIRQFPADRRSRRIAANLLRDIEYQAFVRDRRLLSAREQVGVPEAVGRPMFAVSVDRPASPCTEVAELLQLAATSGMSREDLDLLRGWAAGTSPRAVADQIGVCERTVRSRRHQAVDRVRQLVRDEALV
ncbi:MAG: hypothetical protein R2705_01170 [Ilumatobacteraceae bacterium]